MARAVAINVGANTNDPGFRGPIYPDGRFRFVPIPEREPTREPVPTYADLDLAGVPGYDPAAVDDLPVHLDPSFAEYPCCEAYTYGDPHPVKAGPIAELSPGDWLLFYATLSTAASDRSGVAPSGAEPAVAPSDAEPAVAPSDAEPAVAPSGVEPADWIAPDWGAYLIGAFRIERLLAPDPDADSAAALSPADRQRFRTNAHLRREQFDARVLVAGDREGSGLFSRAVPLSAREAGSEPNRLVTDLSGDSGKGPWWRRPLRFDEAATATILSIVDERRLDDCFAPE